MKKQGDIIMIASKLKKLAASHNMQVNKGVAYGSLRGYAATLSDGSGFKQMQLTTAFPDQQKLFHLQTLVHDVDLKKEYHISELSFGTKRINIIFQDAFGTMKKIDAFIDWFFSLLDEAGATGANICTECNCEITSGHWKLIDGTAYYLHDSCAQKIQRSLETASDLRKQEDTGSYLSGFLGSILGATLGSILWAIVLSIGYVASFVGFVIGWLSEKGYELLHGKQGKGKLLVILISVIWGVFFGTILGYGFSLVGMLQAGELPGYTLGDIPILILFLLIDSEFILSLIGNIVIGLLFAALGVFSLLRRTNKELSDTKIIDLD